MKNYIGILFRQKRPLHFVMARLLRLTGLCRLFIIQQEGYKLHYFPSNASYSLWVNPHARDADLNLLRDYLKAGDLVVDVGANIGDTVLTASIRVGAQGRIEAFEPHPRTFSYLKANLALNVVQNARVHNLALGDRSGEIWFTNRASDDMNQVAQEGEGIPVNMARLDDVMPQVSRVHLLKVDVEGYEKFVFDGARQLLGVTDCVYFETGMEGTTTFGTTLAQILELLAGSGFKLFRIKGETMIAEINPGYRSSRVENLLAMRSTDDFLSRTGWAMGCEQKATTA
jgi:FkbM family methyltransferase